MHVDTVRISTDYTTEEDPTFGPGERLSIFGYVLAAAFTKPGEFPLDYTANGETHYFYIQDGIFVRNNRKPVDQLQLGWDASYGFSSDMGLVRSGNPRESLLYANFIPVRSRLFYLYGTSGEKSGPFFQNGKAGGAFIKISYY